MNNISVEWSARQWFWQSDIVSIMGYCHRNDIKFDFFMRGGTITNIVDYKVEGERAKIRWLLERIGQEHLLAPVV